MKVSAGEIEKAIRDALPVHLQQGSGELASLLIQVINGVLSPEELRARIASNLTTNMLLNALAGKNLQTANATLAFGEGNQFGDIAVRDVAGGNITHLTVNVYYPRNANQNDEEQRSQQHGLDELNACAVCYSPLNNGYYTLPGKTKKFCPHCIATCPRCYGCGSPLGDEHWKLHDGRLLCKECNEVAVYDLQLAQQLFDKTIDKIKSQFIIVNRSVVLRLVDKLSIMSLLPLYMKINYMNDFRIDGLHQRKDSLSLIYILYGMPSTKFCVTVASRYATAWLDDVGSSLSDGDLREGFCEWIAYKYAISDGMKNEAETIINSPTQAAYGVKRFIELEGIWGHKMVIEHVRIGQVNW